MSKVDIILVNWNSGNYLRSCLNLLSHSAWNRINAQVYIVDNASDDDSMERLPSDLLQITCIQNKKNAGFGAACNQAAKIGRSEYILFLNLDVEVSESTIKESIVYMDANLNVSVMGCRQVGKEGRVHPSCSRYFTFPRAMNELFGLSFFFPKTFRHATLMKDWDHNESRMVDNVMGSYYLVRRNDFERAGGFDERFFVYLEDIDLSLSISKQGGHIFYNNDISIIHHGNATTSSVLGYRLFLANQSRLRYAWKHWSKFYYLIYGFSLFTLGFFIRFVFTIGKFGLKQVASVFEAYAYHLKIKKRD